jgi:uncharacterized phage protein (TIGR01671 family)
MKREIKFRGKRIDNGEWVFGVPYFIKSEKVAFIINNCQTLNFSNNDSSFDGLRVIPKTIVEYTGLKDRNGEEIYEGDILELKYPLSSIDEEDFEDYRLIRVVINFQSGCFWFSGNGFTDCNWHFYNSEDRKIIGNIYENTELLTNK